MTPRTIHNGQNYILYDKDRLGNVDDLSFERSELVAKGSILGAAEGRGTTLFIQHNGMDIALRHYHRGGIAARFSSDQYLWTGLQRNRAWKEWKLLARLHADGLPVPEPIAARVTRQGLLYSADIMTRRIPQAQPVAQVLGQRSLKESTWLAIGRCIRHFHDHNVYHADLNANNILLDNELKVYLIDFDRGEVRSHGGSWKDANLARLLRSLNKIKGHSQPFYFSEPDWTILLAGYQGK